MGFCKIICFVCSPLVKNTVVFRGHLINGRGCKPKVGRILNLFSELVGIEENGGYFGNTEGVKPFDTVSRRVSICFGVHSNVPLKDQLICDVHTATFFPTGTKPASHCKRQRSPTKVFPKEQLDGTITPFFGMGMRGHTIAVINKINVVN